MGDELSESLVQLQCEQLQELCFHDKIATKKGSSAILVRLIAIAKEMTRKDRQTHRTDEDSASEDVAS